MPTQTTTLEEEEFDDHGDAEDDYEEVRPLSGSYNYNRRQRQASPPAYLREQKIQLKEAVKLAKQAGTAVEYRGKLNRAAVVMRWCANALHKGPCLELPQPELHADHV